MGNKQRGASPRVTFCITVEKNILDAYKKYCLDNAINASAKVEQLIKAFMNIK